MTIGIYCIKCSISNRYYVGSSQNIERRWVWHKSALKRNKHHSPPLQAAWIKYGPEAFEFYILKECKVQQITNLEQYWMQRLNVVGGDGYNACPEAGSKRGYRHSNQTIQKMRIAAKRIAACPKERKRRSQRAKQQWRQGNFGTNRGAS